MIFIHSTSSQGYRKHDVQHIITLIVSFLLVCLCPAWGMAETKKDKQTDGAQELFTKVYNMAFGSNGASFNYNVNIVGLYKTQGTIMYKGKKSHYVDQKSYAWSDGVTTTIAYTKKREVHIYRQNDERNDKYMSKFKFEPGKFNYSYVVKGNYYIITAKVKDASLLGMKSITLTAQRTTLYPVSVKVKVAFMHATVQISNFHSGNIADSNFIFPRDKFRNYTVIDHRKE